MGEVIKPCNDCRPLKAMRDREAGVRSNGAFCSCQRRRWQRPMELRAEAAERRMFCASAGTSSRTGGAEAKAESGGIVR